MVQDWAWPNQTCLATTTASDATVQVFVHAGETYWVIVDGLTPGAQPGEFTLEISDICEPMCDGRECGGDGCSGVCGHCGALEKCVAHQCVPLAECHPVASLTCDPSGAVGVGTSVSKVSFALSEVSNGMAGSTDEFAGYSCAEVAGADYGAAPEVAFYLTVPEVAFVTVSEAWPAATDIIVLRDVGQGCEDSAQSCLTAGGGEVTFGANPGEVYYLVLASLASPAEPEPKRIAKESRKAGRQEGGRFTGKTYKYSITQLGRTVAAVALRLREEVVIAALSTGVP